MARRLVPYVYPDTQGVCLMEGSLKGACLQGFLPAEAPLFTDFAVKDYPEVLCACQRPSSPRSLSSLRRPHMPSHLLFSKSPKAFNQSSLPLTVAAGLRVVLHFGAADPSGRGEAVAASAGSSDKCPFRSSPSPTTPLALPPADQPGNAKRLLRRDAVLDAADGVTHLSLSRQPWTRMDGVVLCSKDNYQGHCQFFEPGAHDISEALSRRGASLFLPQPGGKSGLRTQGTPARGDCLNVGLVSTATGYSVRLFGWTGLHGPEFRARDNVTSFAAVPGLRNQIRSIEVGGEKERARSEVPRHLATPAADTIPPPNRSPTDAIQAAAALASALGPTRVCATRAGQARAASTGRRTRPPLSRAAGMFLCACGQQVPHTAALTHVHMQKRHDLRPGRVVHHYPAAPG